MKAIANFAIALSDFVRVEARCLRHQLVSTIAMVALVVGAAVVFIGGMVVLLLGLHAALLLIMAQPAALLLTGLIASLVGGGSLWLVVHHAD